MSSLGQAGPPVAHPAGWPMVSGQLPPSVGPLMTRQETGLSRAAGLPPGQTTVLIPGDDRSARGFAAFGGSGKTCLAAALARQYCESPGSGLVVWVNAAGPGGVTAAYAQALQDVGVPNPGDGAERAASRFLDWLAATTRPWLVVLDGLREDAALAGRWPRGPAGQVLVTTELPGSAAAAPSPRFVKVAAFSPREALSYLSAGMRADSDQRIGAVDLAKDLGFMPVTLAQAAAAIAETGMDCRQYRARWAERRRHPALAQASPDVSAMAAAWSLSAELADQLPPTGLAVRALALISMLAPAGIPGAVLTSQPGCAYVTGRPSAPAGAEADVRAAVHNLARAGLVAVDPGSASRTVLAHPTVQAFARQSLSAAAAGQVAQAAAGALAEVWVRRDLPLPFAQALRDCAASLRVAAGGLLWRPECDPVLIQAGRSLDTGGMPRAAVAYWRDLLAASERALGPGHPQTASLRDLLGAAYQASGQASEAIAMYESVLGEREHALGSDHPDTQAVRGRLTGAYLAADHADNAIRLAERTLASREQELGSAHPNSLAAREDLARSYLSGGRPAEAVAAFGDTLADRERTLGPRHPSTIAARAGLASAYLESGQVKAAVAACRRTLADREEVLGADHPDTFAARSALAAAYQAAKKRKDALRLYEQILADAERVHGADHPDTLVARSALASAYESAGKHAYAVAQYERTYRDAQRVFGDAHPFTKAARDNLNGAARYAQSVLGVDLRSLP